MNSEKQAALVNIIEKFAGSGWDLSDVPAKAWLQKKFESNHTIVQNLQEKNENSIENRQIVSKGIFGQ